MSTKGAPHDGQDTVKTLHTIIWLLHNFESSFWFSNKQHYLSISLIIDNQSNHHHTEMLELGKQCDNFVPLKRKVNQNVVIEQLLKFKLCSRTGPWKKNVTIALNETTASDWGSCSPKCTIIRFHQKIQTGQDDWANRHWDRMIVHEGGQRLGNLIECTPSWSHLIFTHNIFERILLHESFGLQTDHFIATNSLCR